MNIIPHKDLSMLQEETEKDFENSIFHSTKKGSVLRLITNSFLSKIANLYKYVDQKHAQTFLSSSDGLDLEEIGALLNCRRQGDSDDKYKYRIRNQVTSLEMANRMSVKLAGKIQEIDTVFVEKNAFGIGTFAVFPVGKQAVFSDKILKQIEYNIEEVVAEGTYFEVINPVLLRTKIYLKLVDNNNVENEYTQLTASVIEDRTKKYMNGRPVGETFSFHDLKNYLFQDDDVRKNIKDILLIKLTINGINCSDEVISTGWNQRIIEHEDEDAIIVEGDKEMI